MTTESNKPQHPRTSDSKLVDRKNKKKKKEKPIHLHDHHHQEQSIHQEVHALDMTEYQNLKSPTTTMKIRLKKKSSRLVNDENGLVSNMKKIIYLDKARQAFLVNMRLAMRIAIGVVIAGIIQTRTPENSNRPFLFLPKGYYLGGLYYAAMMVVFAAARNIGGVLEQIWQISIGVLIALVFNFIVFISIDMTQGNLIRINESLTGGGGYYISLTDLYTVLPLLIIYTLVMFLAPMKPNVQKFAVSTNLYFMLTIVSPMDPVHPEQQKSLEKFQWTDNNIMVNLAIYSVVGAVGTIIALITMILPYPLLAIKDLRKEMEEAPNDVKNILNLIVDSYCFRAKDIKQMDFFHLKLDRQFEIARKRRDHMEALLKNAWWEEVVGLGCCLFTFNKGVAKLFIHLYSDLLQDLNTMKYAMDLQSSHWHHDEIMMNHRNSTFQQKIYLLQVQMNDLLKEISVHVQQQASFHSLSSENFIKLNQSMDNLIQEYGFLFIGLLETTEIESKNEINQLMPLNLFVYSFHALCHTLLKFEQKFKQKNFSHSYRTKNFIKKSIKSFFCQKQNYPCSTIWFATRTTLAIILGVFFSVYIFGFNATVPNAIAMVARKHIGGTYGTTINRIGGLVAGSVVPSIFQFFCCRIMSNTIYHVVNNCFLFVWTTLSMYIYYGGDYAYAGMVSAFVSVSVLLENSCRAHFGIAKVISYNSLTQNSMGIVILFVVELLVNPQSANTLLRHNIKETLSQYGEIFEQLFHHHLAASGMTFTNPEEIMCGSAASGELTSKEIRELEYLLHMKFPALLEDQAILLKEASMEPALWRPIFSREKYGQVLHICRELLHHFRVLLNLVEWHKRRKNQLNAIVTSDASSFGPNTNDDFNIQQEKKLNEQETSTMVPSTNPLCSNGSTGSTLKTEKLRRWLQAQDEFDRCIEGSFDTLAALFSEDFMYSDPDENAIFMQMKEAFRKADIHREGEVDKCELANLLENLIPYKVGSKKINMDEYVEEFLGMVDKDKNGKVSFEEFMDALNNGFRMELELYEKRERAFNDSLFKWSGVSENAAGSGLSLVGSTFTMKNRRTSQAQAMAAPRWNGPLKEDERESASVIDIGDKKNSDDASSSNNTLFHTQSSASIQSENIWKDSEVPTQNYPTAGQSVLDSKYFSNLPPEATTTATIVDAPLHHLVDTQRVSIGSIVFGGADELLNVESFTIKEASNKLKEMYADWLLDEHRRGKDLCMEDFILMSCFLCAIGEISSNLTKLSTVAVS